MPVAQAEIKFYKSAVVGDGNTNGGRLSANPVTSGAASNLFPAVSESERISGITRYRKVFVKIDNDADLPLIEPHVFLDKNTPGGDRITFFPATQTDTQASITGAERQYGGGTLNANVLATATTVDVLVEDGAVPVFQNGDLIRVSDKPDVLSAGNEEYVTLSLAPSVVGNVVSLTFSPALQNGYSAANTRVMAVHQPGDIETSVDNLVVTAAGDGDFNIANLLGDNIGTIEQTWTLTFTGPTTFSVVGDVVGAQGTGSTGAGASPNNASFTKPYFVMQAAGFSGTFQAGDTIVFQTHPAAAPYWLKEVVPAATSSQALNTATLACDGETA